MSNLSVFQFQSQTVRTVTDERGEPWFVAVDVCAVLSIGNSRMALGRLDDDERGVSSIDTLGGPQGMSVVNESGLYSLILGSRKPQAKAFKRWVTHEVLPTIRKTGAYTTRQAHELPDRPTLVDLQKLARQSRGLADNSETRVAALICVQKMIAAVPGVKASMAAAVALNVIERETGMNLDAFRAALPRNSEPMATLNSTGLGALIHEPAVTTNRLLERMGLQKRNARGEWELTEAGKQHGEAYPYANGRHSGYQILWKHSVAVLLRDPQLHIYLQ